MTSISAPALPIKTPGLPVRMVTTTLFAARSMRILLMAAA